MNLSAYQGLLDDAAEKDSKGIGIRTNNPALLRERLALQQAELQDNTDIASLEFYLHPTDDEVLYIVNKLNLPGPLDDITIEILEEEQ